MQAMRCKVVRASWLAVGMLACAPPLDTLPRDLPPASLGTHIYSELCQRTSRHSQPAQTAGFVAGQLCAPAAVTAPRTLQDAALATLPRRLQVLHAARQRCIGAFDTLVQPQSALEPGVALASVAAPATVPTAELAAYLQTVLTLFDANLLQPQSAALLAFLQQLRTQPESLAALAATPHLAARFGWLTAAMNAPSFPAFWQALQHSLHDSAALQQVWAQWQSSCYTELLQATPSRAAVPQAWGDFLLQRQPTVAPETPLAMLLQQVQQLVAQVPAVLPWGLAQLTSSRGDPVALSELRTALAPHLAPLLQLVEVLLRAHETTLAPVVSLLLPSDAGVAAVGNADSAALIDALLDVFVAVAQQEGLLENLLAALAEPRTAALGPSLAQQLSRRDRIDYALDDLNGPPVGALVTPVQRQQPAVGDNRSVMQRLLHLVHDTQQPLRNRAFAFDVKTYAPGEFFYIDNAALFYLQAIVGQAHMTLRFIPEDMAMRYMVEETKDNGSSAVLGFDMAVPLDDAALLPADRRACVGQTTAAAPYDCITFNVSAPAAARLLFAVPDARLEAEDLGGSIGLLRIFYEPLLTPEGAPVAHQHAATLFAWEQDDFLAKLVPLVQAFVQRGRGDLLLQLLDTLHRHWQAARYEPGLAALLGEQQLLTKLARLASVLQTLQLDGQPAYQLVAQSLRALSQPLQTSLAVPLRRADQSLIRQPRIIHLLWHLWRQQLQPGSAAPLPLASLSAFLWGSEATPTGERFTNQAGRTLSLAALNFWQQQAPVVAKPPTPMWQPTQHLLSQALAQPQLRQASADLLRDLLQQPQPLLQSATAWLQTPAVDTTPLRRAVAALLEPEQGVMAQATRIFMLAPPPGAQATLLPRLLARLSYAHPFAGALSLSDDAGESPLQALAAIYAQVNRAAPGASGALSAADYAHILSSLESLLTDPQHGFVRLQQLLRDRL